MPQIADDRQHTRSVRDDELVAVIGGRTDAKTGLYVQMQSGAINGTQPTQTPGSAVGGSTR
jgi:hypothetical protein